MSRARIGVIGAGWWAAANHLPALKADPDCEVVAVNRLGAEDLARLQQAFDVPHAFEDYREMLDTVPMDGVIIASPHVLHHEHALAALAKGCHVLVEKPLATTAADARAIVDAAAAAGRQVVVPYGWNFKAFAARARALAPRVGRIEHVVLQMASALDDLMAGRPMQETEGAMFRPPPSTWADPKRAGGYGWGQLVHALGLLFRIADLEPAKVFACTGQSPAGVDYYDAAVVRFANGATGSLSGAATVPKQCGFQIDMRIFGSEGMLLLDIERERLELHRRDGESVTGQIAAGDGAYECVAPVKALVDICRGLPVDNPAPGIVGLRAVEVLDALYRSAASGTMEEVR
ncbi:Gfo/Idh/MocA family protein [Labrys wisconsinensis]|uniref:Dehydrogenase n=1 Tax=Labrys wisconsinensis TaxID=425677 RepID=A0ABU0JJM3_9HYPH|nr:Gfo/Idh/MocA family oxidoreductase [Labrys wisconsinensis]MDQ0474475.1 putative dehydrogenase [Labrys wisconsinensis]